jgi:acetamidase/formamidase
VDFAVTQVANGNWGVHGIIPKVIFEPMDGPVTSISRNPLDESNLKLSAANVHWGYFSKNLKSALTIENGDTVVLDMVSHRACDDYDKMIRGDKTLEEIYSWNASGHVEVRGTTGWGDGVHILTGPIYVNGAEPGDILKVEILRLEPRANPDGKTFGVSSIVLNLLQCRIKLTHFQRRAAQPPRVHFIIVCRLRMVLISKLASSPRPQV